jgi:hypothetical protein
VRTTASQRVAERFARFATREAHGRSALYEELARGVAGDPDVLRVLAGLPPGKQQPNLLFGAVRLLHGTPSGWAQFRGWLLEHREEVVRVVLARRTQTNEPARCAALLPVLAALPQPLALLEVGAAAGLCLLPDRYAYAYGEHHVAPTALGAARAPTFACRAGPHTPLPDRGVDVAWRAGLDLEPLDVRDPDDTAWLEALVWPGEGRRLELLRAALAVAREHPPELVRGDLLHDLATLAARAPRDATLVVFHTAVLAYVPDARDRAAFARTVRGLGAVWIAAEAPEVLGATDVPGAPRLAGSHPFLLARDGRPVAWTDPHGARVDWLASGNGREAPSAISPH